MDEQNRVSAAESGAHSNSEAPRDTPSSVATEKTPSVAGNAVGGQLFSEEKPTSGSRKALNVLGNVLFILFMAFLAFMVLVTLSANRRTGDSSFFGYSLYIVRSSSMSPAIPEGAVVFSLAKEASKIKEDDVITYFRVAGNVTHRVVEANYKADTDYYSFVTKGDGNEDPDPYAVPYEDIRGVVILSVPLLGYLLDFLRPPNMGLLIVVVPCLIIIVVELTKLVRFAKESKRRGKP